MILNWFLGERNSIACNTGSHFVLGLLDKIMQILFKNQKWNKTNTKQNTTKETHCILREKCHVLLLNISLKEKRWFFFLKKHVSERVAFSDKLKQQYPSKLHAFYIFFSCQLVTTGACPEKEIGVDVVPFHVLC